MIAEEKIKLLRDALVGLVGTSDIDELKAMAAMVRLTTAPAQDKAVLIAAVNALLETAEDSPSQEA